VTEKNLVTIQNLSKKFPSAHTAAVDDLTVVIPTGKIVGLVGPDGAGKTTLIRLIAGLLLPTAGKITVAGYSTVNQAENIHDLLGYMPQKFGLYEDLTVIQNLMLYAELRGVDLKTKHEKIEYLLKFTNLQLFTERLAGDLSGGMKQKLGLACALIKKPTLLLLDEPSVGVDPISRRELWIMVHDLIKEGITVVWSTAYLDEAERCDSVLLLNQGKLLYQGPPNELTQRVQGRTFLISNIPSNRRMILSEVLKQDNIIDGIIQGSQVRIVTKEKEENPLNQQVLKANPQLKIESTPPRFEDAFIDILGGGPGGGSELAEKMPEVKEKKQTIIEAHNLVKRFRTFTAVDHITFNIQSGEIFGLLGPNGAGKSTTFKMMCGLLKPTEGAAFVDGLDLQIASGQARAHIGYMAQKFALYGHLSVKQNLDFFSGIYNLRGVQRRQIVEEMIDIFSLQPFLSESADLLPLGFKQRLALSCAVMHRPAVIFLDEPTSGVDPITRREFWNHINGLVEKGITIMVTTHFMDEAEYCDRIGLIYRSKLIQMGTPDELKAHAKTENDLYPTLEDAFITLIKTYDREHPNE
jgi:ABC-2 type transport system ATP-binding protein